ncbi:tetratricopeptide repeat protein [Dissulfurispira sp.]|uniref:tetratricopeptide repeat protein n=1 Tax=Dissulfurispira sp. TaxID=2817609 RepID=UPI002FD8F8EF
MKKLIFLVGVVFFLICPYSVFAAEDFFGRGIAEFKAENYEEALILFERAYREKPTDPQITSYLGLTHREIQNYSEAVKFFKETLKLDPKAADVKFLLADVLYGIGSYEEALTIIEAAINEGVRPAQSNYLKGLILIKLKKNTEAVEAFKKAKELDTSLTQQADFQIATVYVQKKEFKKAKEAFKGLMTVDPTSDWALFSKDYLEAIEKMPPPYRLILGVGLQYDDNALANPIDESLVDITKQEDWKRLYSLLGEYTVYEKGPWNMKASYSLNITQHDKSDYNKKNGTEKVFSQDTVSHTFSIMPSYNTETSVTSLLLSYNYLEVDYIKYKQSFTISPSYTFIIKGNNLGQVFFKYRKDEFNFEYNKRKFGAYLNKAEDRDASYFSLGVGYIYTFKKGNGLFNVRLEGDINDADGPNWDYAGVKVSSGLLYPFIDNKFRANIFAEAYRQNYSNVHSIYKKIPRNTRKDDNYTAQASLTYTILKPLDISVGYTHLKTLSNIAVYEYKKNLYTLSLEYRF